jgi:hypothetical protein
VATDPNQPDNAVEALAVLWGWVAVSRRTPAVLAAKAILDAALEERAAAVAELARVRAGDDSVRRLAAALGIKVPKAQGRKR